MRSQEVFGEWKGNSADGLGVLSKLTGGTELTLSVIYSWGLIGAALKSLVDDGTAGWKWDKNNVKGWTKHLWLELVLSHVHESFVLLC